MAFLWRLGLVLLTALMTTQLSARSLLLGWGEGEYAPHLPGWAGLTPAYVLLAGLLVLLVVRCRRRPWREWALPPARFAALALWALAAWLLAPLFFPRFGNLAGGSLKEVLQLGAIFAGGSLVFREALREHGFRRRLLAVFLGVAALNVAVAGVQYFWTARWPEVRQVMGLYANRHTFGLLLALALPLAAGGALAGRHWPLRLVLGALVLAGFSLLLSGGAWLAAALGVLLAGALAGRGRLPAAVLLVALPFLAGIYLMERQGQSNAQWLVESVSPLELVPRVPAAGERQRWEPARRYVRWQAAANLFLEVPLCGTGPGGFRDGVKQVGFPGPMGSVPLPNPQRLDDPHYWDMDNTYLVVAGEQGLPGALLLVGVLLAFLGTALRARAAAADETTRGLAAGLAGAALAIILAGVFCHLLIRGVALPLVFLCLAADAVREEAVESYPV